MTRSGAEQHDHPARALPLVAPIRTAHTAVRAACVTAAAMLALGSWAGAVPAQQEEDPERRFMPPIAGTWDPVRSLGQPGCWESTVTLWVHDFRGRDADGRPDQTGFETMRTYLRALRNGVQAYERTEQFPVYLIVLDQFFYEVTHGRRWLTLLERPLRHRVRLPDEHGWMEDFGARRPRRLPTAGKVRNVCMAAPHGLGSVAACATFSPTSPATAFFLTRPAY